MATENRFVRPLTGMQKIAIERMWRLIELAGEQVNLHPERSQKYVLRIRGLSTRFRVPVPREIRDQYCKTCGNYWREGITVKRRLKGKTWNFNCQICHTLTRRKVKVAH